MIPISERGLDYPLPRDARRITRIEAAAWRTAYATLLPPSILRQLGTEERVMRWMTRIRGERRGLGVVRHKGLIAGYATFGVARFRDLEPGFAGEVYELYVDPNAHRLGLGRRLLMGAFHHLRDNGFHWAVLEVLRDNHGARRFYEAIGMQTEGKIRRRAPGIGTQSARGLRYSIPRSAVPVVRYEAPLVSVLDTF